MKARKTMKNQALIQEVITQLSPKFAPKIPDIKKVGKLLVFLVVSSLCFIQAIDTLMEKEYIERVQNTRDTFAYMA
jgi:cullin 1